MPISPRASPIGLPALRASSLASSSACSSSAFASRCSSGAPVVGASARHAGKAALARSTAASVSSTPARGTSAITSSVAGSMTWIIRTADPRRARASSTNERDHPAALVLLGVPEHAEHEAGRPPARSPRSPRRPPARPVTRRPSPSSSTPWWWCDLTALARPRPRARRATPARGAPRGRRRSRARRGGRWWPTASGTCWSSVPPSATFSICMPRQIPSSGMSRSSARWASASSKRSRSGHVPSVSACGARPVGARVHVGAAREHQSVEQVEQLVGLLGDRVVGRQQDRHARRPPAPRSSRCAARGCRAPPRRASARPPWRCRCR